MMGNSAAGQEQKIITEQIELNVQNAGVADRGGDYASALADLSAALDLSRMLDPANPEFLAWLSAQIARLQNSLGQFENAIISADLAISALSQEEGKLHELHIDALNFKATAYLNLNRPQDVITVADKIISVGIDTAIPSFKLAKAIEAKATAFLLLREPHEAMAALRDAKDLRKKVDPVTMGSLLLVEAKVAKQLGDFDRAADIFTDLVEQGEERGDPRSRARALFNLAEIALLRGDYARAEMLGLKVQALAELERFPNNLFVGQILHLRGLIYGSISDHKTALDLFEDAYDRFMEALPANNIYALSSLTERVHIYLAIDKTRDAYFNAKIAVAGFEESESTDRYEYILAQSALGLALAADGQREEALRILGTIRSDDEDGPKLLLGDRAPGLLSIAEIALLEGEIDVADQAADDAISVLSDLKSDTVELMGEAVRLKTMSLIEQERFAEALTTARENAERARRAILRSQNIPVVTSQAQPVALRRQMAQYIQLLADQYAITPTNEILGELFAAAQLVHINETSRAANGVLTGLVGGGSEVHEYQALQKSATNLARRIAMVSHASQSKRRSELLQEYDQVGRKLAELEGRLSGIDKTSRGRLNLVSMGEAQQSLRQDEALWINLFFEAASFAFMLTKDEIQFEQIDVPGKTIADNVRALRASLTPKFDENGKVILSPFETELGYSLYELLFGTFQSQLEEIKHVFVVPDGPLQTIDAGVLLVSQVDENDTIEERASRFFGLRKSTSVLPNIGLLKNRATISGATTDTLFTPDFIGFGDPIFDASFDRNLPVPENIIELHTGLANSQFIGRNFSRLEFTSAELNSVKKIEGTKGTSIHLSEDATEHKVRAVNFTKGSIVSFATHAVVVGEFDNLREPALVLTPPQSASQDNDGLLTASEISQLNIPASLVILSACNTGGGSGRHGAPGLSGLVRSFMEAGSSLVVASHWSVSSVSTFFLMRRFLKEVLKNEQAAKSEAMRISKMVLAEKEETAHPFYWGAFSIIGGR